MLIEGNRTDDNKGYGIYVPKPSHVIKGNSANDNGSWGIYVSEGYNGRINVDAGGNRARATTARWTRSRCCRCSATCQLRGRPAGRRPTSSARDAAHRGPADPSTSDVATFRFTGTDNARRSRSSARSPAADAGFAPVRVAGRLRGPRARRAHLPGARRRRVRQRRPYAGEHIWRSTRSPAAGAGDHDRRRARTLTTVAPSARSRSSPTSARDLRVRARRRGVRRRARVRRARRARGTRGIVTYTGLSVGTHTFHVRAIDLDGNVDATPAAWTWRIGRAAGADRGRLRRVRHPQHRAHQRPDRLPGPRADRRRRRHHDRPRRPRHRRHRPRRRRPQQRLRRRDDHRRPGPRVRLRRPAQPGHGAQRRRPACGSRPTRRPASCSPTPTRTAPGNTSATTRSRATARHRALQRHPPRGRARQRVRANQDDGSTSSTRASTADHAQRDRPLLRRRRGHAGRRRTRVTDNVLIAQRRGRRRSARNCCRPTTTRRAQHDRGPGAGVLVADSRGTLLLDNDVRESNGAGAALDLARDTVVRGNDLRGNAGIALSESTGNLIEFNDAGGARGTGIALESLSIDNEVVHNQPTATAARASRSRTPRPAGDGNLIERNPADANGGDGIIVAGGGHTITRQPRAAQRRLGHLRARGRDRRRRQLRRRQRRAGPVLRRRLRARRRRPARRRRRSRASRRWSPTAATRASPTSARRRHAADRPRLRVPAGLAPTTRPGTTASTRTRSRTSARACTRSRSARSTPASWPTTRPRAHVEVPAAARGRRAARPSSTSKPRAETWSLDALFTFHSNEPDVTFECRVDTHAVGALRLRDRRRT